MSDGIDWKAFFSPKIALRYPVRTLAMLSMAVGVIKSAFDLNNRYLAFGLFLLCLSFAGTASREIYRPSNISYTGQKTLWTFSPAALFQSLALWPLTVAFALLCLHQLGFTPRLDAYLSSWMQARSPLQNIKSVSAKPLQSRRLRHIVQRQLPLDA